MWRYAISWLMVLIASDAFAQPSIADVETKALNARKSIRNGYVSMKGREVWIGEGGKAEYEVERQIWFTRDRIRVDLVKRHLGSNVKPVKSVQSKNFDGTDKNFGWDVGVTVAERGKSTQRGKTIPTGNLFDPRVLGFCTDTLLNTRLNSRMDGHVASQYRKDLKMEEVLLNGTKAWLISFKWKSNHDSDIKVWLSAEQDNNLIKIVNRQTIDQFVMLNERTVTLKHYPGGVWYPQEYYSSGNRNETTHVTDQFTVIDAWFNGEDPLDAFTYGSFGLKPGDHVLDRDTDQTFVWTGDKLILRDDRELLGQLAQYSEPPQPVDPVPGRVNVWMVLLCLATAVLSFYFFFRFLKARR